MLEPASVERERLARMGNTLTLFDPPPVKVKANGKPKRMPWTADWTHAPKTRRDQGHHKTVMAPVKREKAKGTTDELTPRWAGGHLPVRQANRSIAEGRVR